MRREKCSYSNKLSAHTDKLASLRTIADAGGLREAAAQIGIAPSTLSERITALEHVVGRTLTTRDTGPMRLSPFGETLAAKSAPLIAALDALVPVKGAARSARTLRIGAYESLAVHVLPMLLRDLTELGGVERIDVSMGRSAALVSQVRRGQMDVAVVVGRAGEVRLSEAVLATDELALVRPRSLREDDAHALLARGDWVGLSPGRSGHARFYRRFCQLSALSASPLLACDSFEAIRSIAEQSQLPAVLPERVFLRAPGKLAELPVSATARSAGRHDIVLVGRPAHPLFDGLANQLRKALASTTDRRA